MMTHSTNGASQNTPLLLEWWKPVLGYEGLYEVSNTGRICSLLTSYGNPRLRPMRFERHAHGYLQIGLRKNRKRKHHYGHILVMTAFLPQQTEKHEVNHMDGNKQNNRLSNLEYTTSKGNKAHAFAFGLYPVGENHHQAKLTETKVREIRLLLGTMPKTEIAKRYGIEPSTLRHIELGRTWKHVT